MSLLVHPLVCWQTLLGSDLKCEVSSFQRLLSIYTHVAFGSDESVLFMEVS